MKIETTAPSAAVFHVKLLALPSLSNTSFSAEVRSDRPVVGELFAVNQSRYRDEGPAPMHVAAPLSLSFHTRAPRGTVPETASARTPATFWSVRRAQDRHIPDRHIPVFEPRYAEQLSAASRS